MSNLRVSVWTVVSNHRLYGVWFTLVNEGKEALKHQGGHTVSGGQSVSTEPRWDVASSV